MKKDQLILSGDENTPALPLSEDQVNHLRRVLAWMRCEFTLDSDMQRGFIQGAAACVQHGFSTPEKAGDLLAAKADEINRVPAYVRQGVKMLTKALGDHERCSGIVDTK